MIKPGAARAKLKLFALFLQAAIKDKMNEVKAKVRKTYNEKMEHAVSSGAYIDPAQLTAMHQSCLKEMDEAIDCHKQSYGESPQFEQAKEAINDTLKVAYAVLKCYKQTIIFRPSI